MPIWAERGFSMADKKMTAKQATEALRTKYLDKVKAMLTAGDDPDEVLVTGTNEVAIPCVDALGEDQWIVISVKVPTGSRDGDPYDGYSMAEEYKIKQADKAAKAKESAKKKAEKIERDKQARALKAEAKRKAEAIKAGDEAVK